MNGCVQSAAAIIEIKIKYTYQWRIEIRIEKQRDVKYLIFLHPKINFLNTLLRSNQKSNPVFSKNPATNDQTSNLCDVFFKNYYR